MAHQTPARRGWRLTFAEWDGTMRPGHDALGCGLLLLLLAAALPARAASR
jgi:hypothetical protein